jgi:hypothetical protein
MKRETFKSRTRKLLGGAKGKGAKGKTQKRTVIDLSKVEAAEPSRVELPTAPVAETRMEVTIDLIREMVTGSTEIATANREKIEAFIKDYEASMKSETASASTASKKSITSKDKGAKGKGAKGKSEKKTKKNKGSATTAAATGPAPQTDNGISLFFNTLKTKRTEYIKVFKALVSDFVKPAQTLIDKELARLVKELNVHEASIPQLEKDIGKLEKAISLLVKQISNAKASTAQHKQAEVPKKDKELKDKESELESKKNELKKAESEFEDKKRKIETDILDIKNLQIDVHNFIYIPKTPKDFEMYNTKYGLDYLLDTEEYNKKVDKTLGVRNPGNNIVIDDLITYVFDNDIFMNLVNKVGRDESGAGEAYFYDREDGFKVIKSNNLQRATDREHYDRFYATTKAVVLGELKKALDYEFDAKKYMPANDINDIQKMYQRKHSHQTTNSHSSSYSNNSFQEMNNNDL